MPASDTYWYGYTGIYTVLFLQVKTHSPKPNRTPSTEGGVFCLGVSYYYTEHTEGTQS